MPNYPPRLCECGCGEMFTPRRADQRHKNLAHARKCPHCHGGHHASPQNLPEPEENEPEDWIDMIQRILAVQKPLPEVSKQVLVPTGSAEELGFEEQEMVALFSDYHRGLLVDPEVTGGLGKYDVETARTRLHLWRNRVLRFAQLYQQVMPVKTLWLIDLGDDIEGSGEMFPSQSWVLDEWWLEQYLGFVEDQCDVLTSFLHRFDKVRVVKVPGNHGRTGKKRDDRPRTDNIETVAYTHIRDRLYQHADCRKRIAFDIEKAWFTVADIMDHKFFFTHGEGVLPYSPYAQRGGFNVKLRMNSLLGYVLNYMVVAHHHSLLEFQREIGGSFIMNGTFVGPTSVDRYFEGGLPSQKLLLIHPRWGVTHESNLYLANPSEVRNVEEVA